MLTGWFRLVVWKSGKSEGSAINLPVVPHKAVAEVSKNRKPIGEIGCCESGMAGGIH